MAKYALLLEYDGSTYSGWQIQANTKTIQGELEAALSAFANEKITTITAGRTDTGVHATHQVVHFSSLATRKIAGWIHGVNCKLPASIRVKDVLDVPDEFDARFSALSRTYHYYLMTRPVNSAIFNQHVGWYYQELDIEEMRLAASKLIGRHDFSSFRASGCQANTPIRELRNLKIETRGNMIRFALSANAFLHHMVRNIVGGLLYVGNGRLSVDEFEQIFIARDRKLAPPTFMPNGLYLVNVEYPSKMFAADTETWLFNI